MVKNLNAETNQNYLDVTIVSILIYILTGGGGTKVSGHVKCEIPVRRTGSNLSMRLDTGV